MDIKIIGKEAVKKDDPRYVADVDYTSGAAFNQTIAPYIGHRECEMLLQNLADAGYPEEKVKAFGSSYGFAIDGSAWADKKTHSVASSKIKPQLGALGGEWDDNKFEEYKENTLYERMANPAKNYTFILAKDNGGKTIGLVSFNAPTDKSQLRVLNFTVHRDHRKNSTEIVGALSREVMRYAIGHGFDKAPINAPVSNYAIAKGNNKAYLHVAESYGVSGKEVPDGSEQNLLVFTPREVGARLGVSHEDRARLREARKAAGNTEIS
jgi:hypothetical protein